MRMALSHVFGRASDKALQVTDSWRVCPPLWSRLKYPATASWWLKCCSDCQHRAHEDESWTVLPGDLTVQVIWISFLADPDVMVSARTRIPPRLQSHTGARLNLGGQIFCVCHFLFFKSQREMGQMNRNDTEVKDFVYECTNTRFYTSFVWLWYLKCSCTKYHTVSQGDVCNLEYVNGFKMQVMGCIHTLVFCYSTAANSIAVSRTFGCVSAAVEYEPHLLCSHLPPISSLLSGVLCPRSLACRSGPTPHRDR